MLYNFVVIFRFLTWEGFYFISKNLLQFLFIPIKYFLLFLHNKNQV